MQINDDVDDVPEDFVFMLNGRPVQSEEKCTIGHCPEHYSVTAGRRMPILVVQDRDRAPVAARTRALLRVPVSIEGSHRPVGEISVSDSFIALDSVRAEMGKQMAAALPGDWVFVIQGAPLSSKVESRRALTDVLPNIVIRQRGASSPRLQAPPQQPAQQPMQQQQPMQPMQQQQQQQQQQKQERQHQSMFRESPSSATAPPRQFRAGLTKGPGGFGMSISGPLSSVLDPVGVTICNSIAPDPPVADNASEDGHVTEVRDGPAAVAGVEVGYRIFSH